MKSAVVALLAVALGGPGHSSAQAPSTILERHDFSERTSRFDLPGRLREVSGLAVTPDGRLFAHDDERAVIYEIDAGEGRVTKAFAVGDPAVGGDFEGIAVVGERFFLVTSHGLLYEFREMPNGAGAPYRVTDTELGAVCEIEGLDYDAETGALLFACKVSAPERGRIVIHRIPVDPEHPPLAPIEIDRQELRALGVDERFAPSAVAIDPTGTVVLLSASGHGLIEVDRSGHVLSGISLSSDRHRQPEGLAFGPDGTLYVSDEGGGRDARVTTYARVR